jgi:hypothetical protein
MVFMTAVRNDGIDAAVWYHGADTEKYLEEVTQKSGIEKGVLGSFWI